MQKKLHARISRTNTALTVFARFSDVEEIGRVRPSFGRNEKGEFWVHLRPDERGYTWSSYDHGPSQAREKWGRFSVTGTVIERAGAGSFPIFGSTEIEFSTEDGVTYAAILPKELRPAREFNRGGGGTRKDGPNRASPATALRGGEQKGREREPVIDDEPQPAPIPTPRNQATPQPEPPAKSPPELASLIRQLRRHLENLNDTCSEILLSHDLEIDWSVEDNRVCARIKVESFA